MKAVTTGGCLLALFLLVSIASAFIAEPTYVESSLEVPIQLVEGQASALAVSSQTNCTYFATPAIALSPDKTFVTISLNLYSGSASAIVLNDVTSGNWTFATGMPSAVQIRFDDPKWQTSTLSIIVRAGTDICISVLYSVYDQRKLMGVPVTLQDGVTILGSVPWDRYIDYQFPMNETTPTPLSFVVSSVSGDPDLFVTVQDPPPPPRIDSYAWVSAATGSDLLLIPTTDPKYKNGVMYSASVYGMFSSAAYTIAASVEAKSRTVFLMERTPHVEMAPAGQYRFFYFYHAPLANIRITVTGLSSAGDPDICVATSVQPMFPNCMWSSRGFGADEVLIKTTDPNFKEDYFYFIGIQAFGADTTFQVTVASEGDSIVLADGVSVRVNTTTSSPARFVFTNVDPQIDLAFVSTDVSSHCVLYASHLPDPDSSQYDQVGVGTGTGQEIRYLSGTAEARRYYLSAYPVSPSPQAECSVMALVSIKNVTLTDGVPVYFESVVTSGYRHYLFTVTNASKDVVVAVTPLGEGDPDLFGSYSFMPNRDHADFKSERLGSDSFVVHAGLPEFRLGVLMISVYGWRSCDYAVEVHTSGMITTLTTGLPINGAINDGQYDYFQVIVPPQSAGKTLVMAVTVVFGDADLYVGYGSAYERPSRFHYQWNSIRFGGVFLEISGAQAGTYYIGVYGFRAAYYTITGFLNDPGAAEELTEGRATTDMLLTGQTKDYKVFLNDAAGWTLSILPLSGFTNAWLKYGSPATPTNYDYMTTQLFPGNILHVNGSAMVSRTGLWYLKLNGTTDALVSALADYGKSTLLEDGTPVFGRVFGGRFNYMKFIVPPPFMSATNVSAGVEIEIQVMSGGIDVFISNTTNPSSTNCFYSAFGPGDLRFVIPFTLIFPDSSIYSRNLYIGIRGQVADPTLGNRYAIYASTPSEEVSLIRGLPMESEVLPGALRRYKAGVIPEAATPRVVTVKAFSCDNNPPPVIYMAQNRTPSATDYDAKSDPVTTGYVSTLSGALQGLDLAVFHYGVASSVANQGSVFSFVRYTSMAPIPDASAVLAYLPGNKNDVAVLFSMSLNDNDAEYSVGIGLAYDSVFVKNNYVTVCGCDSHFLLRTPFLNSANFTKEAGWLKYVFSGMQAGLYTATVVHRARSTGLDAVSQPFDIPVAYPALDLPKNQVINTVIQPGVTAQFMMEFYEPSGDFHVDVTPYVGTVKLFLRYGAWANETSYTFRDLSNYPGNTVYVSRSSVQFHQGIWFVGIKNNGTNIAVIRLAASTTAGVTSMEDGMPMVGSCQYGITNVYNVTMTFNSKTATFPLAQFTAAVMIGRVDLLVANVPDVVNNYLAMSRGPGSRFVPMFAQRLIPAPLLPTFMNGSAVTFPVYIGVTCRQTSQSEYAIVASSPSAMPDLLTGIPLEFASFLTPSGSTRSFQGLGPGTLGNMDITLHECDNTEKFVPATFAMGIDFVPSEATYNRTSMSTAPAMSYMHVEHPFGEEHTYYWSVFPSIAPDFFNVSFYALEKMTDDDHPYPVTGAVTVNYVHGPTVTITFPEAISAISGQRILYSAYIAYAIDDRGFATNLYTACACERNKVMSSGFLPSQFFPAIGDQMSYTFDFLPGSTYVVNVVARDTDGIVSAYRPGTLTVEDTSYQRAEWFHTTTALLDANTTTSFLFPMAFVNDFAVTVTPFVGQVISCLEFGPIPPDLTPSPSKFCDSTVYPGNYMFVNSSSKSFDTGSYYLTVHATTISVFSVLVSGPHGIVTLTEGQTTTGYAMYGQTSVYAYTVDLTSAGPDMNVDFFSDVVFGQVDMILSFHNPPTEANKIDSRTGYGDIFITEPAWKLGLQKVTVFVGIVGQSQSDNVFALSVASGDVPSDIIALSPMERTTTTGHPRLFLSRLLGSDKELYYHIQSCDGNTAPPLYFKDGHDGKIPTPSDYDAVSVLGSSNPYEGSIHLTHMTPIPGIEYSLSVYATGNPGQNWFDIRLGIVGETHRPPTPGAVQIGWMTEDSLQVIFPNASTYGEYVEYAVYVGHAISPRTGQVNHFRTACNAEQHHFFATPFLPSFPLTPDGLQYQYVVSNLSTSTTSYIVSVIARSSTGVDVIYLPVRVGSGWLGSDSFSDGSSLSGGSIFLIVMVCLIFVYVTGGVAFQFFVRKQRGWEMIPNVAFWRMLPGLIVDGYQTLVNCGRPVSTKEESAPVIASPAGVGAAASAASPSEDVATASASAVAATVGGEETTAFGTATGADTKGYGTI